MLTTAVAPVTIVGSPMESGSRAGLAPNTPASYTSSRSGATVRFARLTAMFGRPTPTKHTRCPASSRAAATIIISDLLKAASLIGAPPPTRAGPHREPRERPGVGPGARPAVGPAAG